MFAPAPQRSYLRKVPTVDVYGQQMTSVDDHIWTDVSLDELNSSNSTNNIAGMSIPPGSDATDFEMARRSSGGSRERVYPQAIQRRAGFWGRRTGLEKVLLCTVGVCGLVAIAAGSVFAINANQTPSADTKDSKQGPETCMTEDCVIAAGHILENMDQSANPCEDFFQYACGGWIENNEIPESESKWGIFYELRDVVDSRVRHLVEAPIDPADAQAVVNLKNLYIGCTDTDTIEAAGYGSFVSMAFGDEFGGWPMIQGSYDGAAFHWEAVSGVNFRTYLSDNLLLSYPYKDTFDTSINVLYVDQPSLGLPRSMMVDPDAYPDQVAAYKDYMVDIARIMTREAGEGVSDTDLIAAAEAIFSFESQLANITVPSDQRRNATEMYNPHTLAELKSLYAMDWDAYFGRFFENTDVTIGDDENIILVEPEFFDAFIPLIDAADSAVVADYMYWRRMMNMVSEGPKEFVDAQFAFTSVLYGQGSPTPRWSSCISKASSESRGFAYAVGHEYIREHFDDETKDDADALVNNLRIAFEDLLAESTWMDEATQVLAKEKAEMMIQLVGYPDWLPDKDELDAYYEGARAPDIDTHLDNILGVMDYAAKKGLNTLRETPNRGDWITQPAIVNAFYSPSDNSITFPAGILQPPFFGKGYPRYLNYGAIGVVMGHEITHGFDDQGRQYDGTGSASQWWSDETIAAFTEKAQCYIDQYDGYIIEELIPFLGDDAHVNGEATQGENIADNGGLHESFKAYMNSVASEGEEGPLPGLEQFSAQQMFFIAYSQVWCEKATTEALLNQILTDPHSPGKYRVWGPLSNSPDFVDAFSCPPGSNMNRDEKCDLW